jgi:hypothetical protein
MPVKQAWDTWADGTVKPVTEVWEVICPQCGDDGRSLGEVLHDRADLARLRGPFRDQDIAIGVAQAHVAERLQDPPRSNT